MKKKDVLFISALLAVALIALAGMNLARRQRSIPSHTAPATSGAAQGKEENRNPADPGEDSREPTEAATQSGTAEKPAEAATQSGTTEKLTEAAAQSGTAEKTTEPATQSGTTEQTTEPAARSGAAEGAPEPAAEPASQDRDLSKYGSIVISVNGQYYGDYSLGEDQVIEINDTNVVEIKDGAAIMTHAECPDQLCTYMGPVTGAYGLIVCLPNAVIVEGFDPEGTSDDVTIDGIS